MVNHAADVPSPEKLGFLNSATKVSALTDKETTRRTTEMPTIANYLSTLFISLFFDLLFVL